MWLPMEFQTSAAEATSNTSPIMDWIRANRAVDLFPGGDVPLRYSRTCLVDFARQLAEPIPAVPVALPPAATGSAMPSSPACTSATCYGYFAPIMAVPPTSPCFSKMGGRTLARRPLMREDLVGTGNLLQPKGVVQMGLIQHYVFVSVRTLTEPDKTSHHTSYAI
ncbi:unnamed protein product [Symbiodinium necroappetens]|uniref:Uncharacterized protein n=1 Tax=Symbiodinium necroappetens TaxID=1628268 RepID=A0A812YU71_9DINO|nr:unnamed protein product [Symbiodinium necroappetens]